MVVMYKTARLKRSLEEFAAMHRAELIDAGEGPIVPRALAALRRGRIFITELDELKHWKPAETKVMRLFGRRVRLDRTVELLHRRTGAPVLLGLVQRGPAGRYRLIVEGPEEHHAAPTRLGPDAQLLKRFEHFVYDHPDHWYLWNELHRLDGLAAA
jgi:lauroyl/myristoyl acyltransferase